MKVIIVVMVIQAACVAVVTSFSFASFLSAAPDCPAPGVPGLALKVPDPDDCSKYSLCLQFFGFKLDCPEGQHFSAAANQCLPIAVAGCDPGATEAVPEAQDAPAEAAPQPAAEPAAAEPAAAAPVAVAV
uniref:Putative mucin peritrophin salivary protein n=1 Tax=Amblyomma triste TaxID=251400 RepID=A0A023GC53_AMBTT